MPYRGSGIVCTAAIMGRVGAFCPLYTQFARV